VISANGASVTGSPHVSADAISRTLFDDAKPTPEMVIKQAWVKVHSAVPVRAPFIVNPPT
jgi:hypothetical protein